VKRSEVHISNAFDFGVAVIECGVAIVTMIVNYDLSTMIMIMVQCPWFTPVLLEKLCFLLSFSGHLLHLVHLFIVPSARLVLM
jgi:hypothetical protein